MNNPPDDLSRQARVAARDAQTEVESLRREVDRMMLVTEAVWRIARDKLGCTDAELSKKITEIDLEDGRVDGRKGASPARNCPQCQRVLMKNQAKCLFCGKVVELLPFER